MYLMLMPLKIVNLYIWHKKNTFLLAISIFGIFLFSMLNTLVKLFSIIIEQINSILVIVDQFIVVYIDID